MKKFENENIYIFGSSLEQRKDYYISNQDIEIGVNINGINEWINTDGTINILREEEYNRIVSNITPYCDIQRCFNFIIKLTNFNGKISLRVEDCNSNNIKPKEVNTNIPIDEIFIGNHIYLNISGDFNIKEMVHIDTFAQERYHFISEQKRICTVKISNISPIDIIMNKLNFDTKSISSEELSKDIINWAKTREFYDLDIYEAGVYLERKMSHSISLMKKYSKKDKSKFELSKRTLTRRYTIYRLIRKYKPKSLLISDIF